MKKIILMMALVVVFVAVNASAQDGVTFGLRGGLNLSKQTVSIGDHSASSDTLAGFHVGAIADIKFNDAFYFQPGVMLSTKGAKSGDDKTTLYNLEVPLMFSGKISVADDVAVRINAGPYIGFGLFGSDEAYGDGGYKRFDGGIGFGGGVEFSKYYIGVNYNLGLVNLAPDSLVDSMKDFFEVNDFKIKNRTVAITFGYNF